MVSHAEQPERVTRPHIVDHRNEFQKIRRRQSVNCQSLNSPGSEARKRRRAVVHGSSPCHDDPKSNFTCYGLFFFSCSRILYPSGSRVQHKRIQLKCSSSDNNGRRCQRCYGLTFSWVCSGSLASDKSPFCHIPNRMKTR